MRDKLTLISNMLKEMSNPKSQTISQEWTQSIRNSHHYSTMIVSSQHQRNESLQSCQRSGCSAWICNVKGLLIVVCSRVYMPHIVHQLMYSPKVNTIQDRGLFSIVIVWILWISRHYIFRIEMLPFFLFIFELLYMMYDILF